MKPFAAFLSRMYRTWIRMVLHVNYDFCVWQESVLPPGPKIFCANHFSSSDVHFVTTLTQEPLHMVIGRGFGIPVVRVLLGMMEQIKALSKEDRHHVVDKAVTYLKQGDSVFIFPEGVLNEQRELMPFHAGVARMYLVHPVPIIPIGLIAPKRRVRYKFSLAAGRDMTVVSKNYYANIGHPMEFPEAIAVCKQDKVAAEQMICLALQREVSRLIDDIKQNKFWS